MSWEKKISLVLGDVAFYILKDVRPYTDFSLIINILSRAGVDIGDLNHSTSFVSNWAPVCAEVVDRQLKDFLVAPMIQTGQRPPVKILGDKGTWKHNTRMMSGLTTVVPDLPSLI